jgi:hypothetical protein
MINQTSKANAGALGRALLLGRSTPASAAETVAVASEDEPVTVGKAEPGQRKLVLGREWIIGDPIGDV